MSVDYPVGSKVLAKDFEDGEFHNAEIVEHNGDGSVTVRFTDDREVTVPDNTPLSSSIDWYIHSSSTGLVAHRRSWTLTCSNRWLWPFQAHLPPGLRL